MDNEKCKFAPYQNAKMCQILMGEKCDGYRLKCSFRKTEAEFNESLKKAILLNRKKATVTNASIQKQSAKFLNEVRNVIGYEKTLCNGCTSRTSGT